MSARNEQVKMYEEKTMNYLERNQRYKDILLNFYNWLNKENSTKYNYVRFCNIFLTERSKDLRELNVDDYTMFLSKYRDKNSVYQVNIYTALAHFSKYLFVTKKNKDDPMRNVEHPKQIEKQDTITRRDNNYLKPEELKLYLDNLKNGIGSKRERTIQRKYAERDQFIIYLFLSTGARCSAITQMDLSDIHEENGRKYIMTTEKRGKVRKYFLSDDLEIMLSSYLDLRNELLINKEDNGALFVSKDGNRLSNRQIDMIVRKYGRGIKNLSPHKLRATFGTMLYEKTKDIYMVQQAMGHSSPNTTQIYIRGQKEKIQMESSDMISKELFGQEVAMNNWLNGIMGVAVGDALGSPVQFMDRAELKNKVGGLVKGMESGGLYDMPKGTWTN